MPTLSVRSQTAAALALLLYAAGARADLTGLSYTWDRAQFGAAANGGTRNGAAYFVLPGPQTPGSPLAPVDVGAFTALANGADRYADVAYSLTLILTDHASGESRAVTVTGALDGTVTSDRVNLGSAFTRGSGAQSFEFLGRDFTVVFGFTASGVSPRDWAGAVTASLRETSAVGPDGEASPPVDPPAAAPEPAGLVLAGLAAPALGLAVRRMRRRGPLRSTAM